MSDQPMGEDPKPETLQELNLLMTQPLIDLGWRIDYERKGIVRPGQVFFLEELGWRLDLSRGGVIDDEGELISMEELNESLQATGRSEGDWFLDHNRKAIRRPDIFIPLADMKAMAEALEGCEASRPTRSHYHRDGNKYEYFLSREDMEKAIYALDPDWP